MKTIHCYVSLPPASKNKIADWYNDLSPQERAYTDEFIKNMRKTREWQLPAYKLLGDGLGELRWRSSNKQYRMIGFFHDRKWCALIGCTHKQRRYTPPRCLETARDRKRHIELSQVRTEEYDL